ncbi:MAG: hypothetical protein IK048_00150 [Clostridia bacterium]|nr:hypothetical protein [Clostridia bacterium]
MSVKFIEEFNKASENKFDMLKFASATYNKQSRTLDIKFIIDAFEIRKFGDEERAEVQKICQSLFDGVKVNVAYQKSYADENVVKNKVIEFFNKNNQMIFRRLKDENLAISVDNSEILIKITFDTPTYMMLKTGDLVGKLKEFLEHNFNQEITIDTEEQVVDLKQIMQDDDMTIETTIRDDAAARIVKIELGKKIYSRVKIEGLPHLPGYVIDVKGANDNVVLAGKMFAMSKYMYKNKKFDPQNPSAEPEKLPLVRFLLDDTTSKISCVCFPKDDDLEKIESIEDGDTIVCVGKVGLSTYDSALTFTVSAIFECEIDFGSVRLTALKPVPKKYTTVFPKPYYEIGQKSLLDTEKVIPDYFKGKTLVVYDLEATDKFVSSAEIIEIAACKIVDGVETETFQTLVKPECSITQEITALTHIDNLMVADAPTIDQVLPDFYKFTRDSILVGHNISGYDYPLIKIYADKYGYNFDNELKDTLLLARQYLTELPNFKLETISKVFGISHENAHRALSDVMATCEALKIIARRM